MRVAIYGALLALIVSILASFVFAREPVYAFDGYVYGIRAQTDAGIPYAQAIAHARDVYGRTPAMQKESNRRWIESSVPQWWNLFSIRVLYPRLGSLLWRRYDFESLFLISLAAYVIAALLTYGMLLRCTRPEFAALIALLVAVFPQSRLIARSDLTDMPAYALLAASLWSMMAFARNGRGLNLALAIVCCTLLSLTRPVPYILVCAAIPLVFTATFRGRGLLLAALGIALCGAVEVAMNLTHADIPAVAHYGAAVLRTFAVVAEWWYTQPAGLIALGALWIKRREPEALVALGAWLSIVPTVFLNPIPFDMPRVLFLPSFISLACGLAYASQILNRAYRATIGERPSARRDRNTQPQDDRHWSEIQTNAS